MIMPTRTSRWPAGTPCWVDLAVPDVPTALRFYEAVLGWSFVDTGPEFGSYQIAQVRGHAAAGIGPVMQEGQPSAWTVYLATDDADATAKAVDAHGGTQLVEPKDIPGTGRMAIALDPTGAAFGVWQATEMIGAGVYNEPGSLVWEDARLPDPAAGKRFYSEVFGYSYQPVEGAPPEYETFGAGGEPFGGMGGMMGLQEGTPGHWVAYFSVAAVDTAVAAAESAGGSIAMAPVDTPFGRMAAIVDPFGATFSVHAPPAG
jgi:predicted enzyme related to lactoylglutathione lyase